MGSNNPHINSLISIINKVACVKFSLMHGLSFRIILVLVHKLYKEIIKRYKIDRKICYSKYVISQFKAHCFNVDASLEVD